MRSNKGCRNWFRGKSSEATDQNANISALLDGCLVAWYALCFWIREVVGLNADLSDCHLFEGDLKLVIFDVVSDPYFARSFAGALRSVAS
jgi:hypothetical protein